MRLIPVDIVARRHALQLFEYPAEIEGALVPQFVGDLIDLERSLIQHFLGTFDFCVVYIIYKSHIVVLGKQDRQIIRADVEDVGELIQRNLLVDVFIDIFFDSGDGAVLVILVVLGKQAAQTVAQHGHPGEHLRNCLRLIEAIVPVGGFVENLI